MMRWIGQCFLIYSFLGWLLEGGYNWAIKGYFRKPNFLYGPFKPMYGFGCLLLVGSYKYDKKHFGYHCCFLPLFVEYISALWLEQYYKLRYWDYSREIMQLNGRICLKFALYWVVLAQMVVYLVQPLVNLFLHFTGKLVGWTAIFHLFFVDCILTLHQRKQQCRKRRYVKQLI